MQSLLFTELRDRLAGAIRTIEATQEPLNLSRRGKAKAVSMSCAQYQRLTAPTFDLGAAIAGSGLTLNDSSFYIKFQQFDNFPLTTDGRGWDGSAAGAPQ